jgi:hypothetical protein
MARGLMFVALVLRRSRRGGAWLVPGWMFIGKWRETLALARLLGHFWPGRLASARVSVVPAKAGIQWLSIFAEGKLRVFFATDAGGCPAARHFLLLRQKKVPKEKATPGSSPLRGFLRCSQTRAAAELVARMGDYAKGFVCARHSDSPRGHLPRLLRRSAPLMGAPGVLPRP